MSQNAQKFEEFLKTKNVTLEKTGDEDVTTFILREQIGAPLPTTIGVMFNAHDALVNIVAYRFLKINKAKKKQKVLELVNDLNVAYTVCKYVLKDDGVTLHISLPCKDNFSAELLHDLIILFLNTLKHDYPRFEEVLAA